MKTALGMLSGIVLIAGCASTEAPSPGASATAKLEPRSGSKVEGTVTFTQIGDVVRVSGEVRGHTKGPKGFHIHEKGDCSDPKGMSTGGHFNPHTAKHGGPYDPVRHAGDLGNIVFDDQGVSKLNFTVGGISVTRDKSDGIIGRGLIVHGDRDDLETDPTGNAGARAACGVIQG